MTARLEFFSSFLLFPVISPALRLFRDHIIFIIAVNKAQTLTPYMKTMPKLSEEVFVAPNASVIGDVEIGPNSSVFYGSVLRGDVNKIRVGEKTNIQDNVVIHVAKHNVTGTELPTVIGSGVTVGHGATIHAATIEDSCVIGMGATVMDGAVVQKGSVVAAGALVTPGTVVKSGQVWSGRPAKYLRDLSSSEMTFISEAAEDYSILAAVHADENAKSFSEIELDNARRYDRQIRDPDFDLQQGIERDPVTREVNKYAEGT